MNGPDEEAFQKWKHDNAVSAHEEWIARSAFASALVHARTPINLHNVTETGRLYRPGVEIFKQPTSRYPLTDEGEPE